MQRRPWGNALMRSGRDRSKNFWRDKAREKEEKWKAFEAKKEKVLEEIDDFKFDRDRIRYRFTDKFLDGMEDHEIAGRLADLWWHHDRYKKHSGPEYVKRRNAAIEAFKDIRPSSAWTEDLWGDYYDKEAGSRPRISRSGYHKATHARKNRARTPSRTGLGGTRPRLTEMPLGVIFTEFTNYFGSADELFVFKRDIDKLVAEMKAKRFEEKVLIDVRASVVDAVFEAHALKGRKMRV